MELKLSASASCDSLEGMPPTVLSQIVSAISAGHYLALIVIVSLYVRKLASTASAFPFLNIPTTWLPTISAAGGLVYGVASSIQGGEAVGASFLDCAAAAASSGFLDGLLTAIFAAHAAPAWARAIVGAFDNIAGGGGSTAAKGASAFGTRDSVKPPALSPKTMLDRINERVLAVDEAPEASHDAGSTTRSDR
jgi:hypothetical protein